MTWLSIFSLVFAGIGLFNLNTRLKQLIEISLPIQCKDLNNRTDALLSESEKLLKEIESRQVSGEDIRTIKYRELRDIVFVAYSCRRIRIRDSCRILNLNHSDFKEQWNTWIKLNPCLLKIFNDEEYQKFLGGEE